TRTARAAGPTMLSAWRLRFNAAMPAGLDPSTHGEPPVLSRGFAQAEPPHGLESNACTFDERSNRAAAIAADRADVLECVQPILPPRDAWFVRAAVLEDDQLSVSLQHTMELRERTRRICNRAERQRADCRVDGLVGNGQTFGFADDHRHRDAG